MVRSWTNAWPITSDAFGSRKSGRRNLATGSFVYFTIPTDEIGSFKLYNCILSNFVSYNCEIDKNCRLRDYVAQTSRLPNASFVIGHAFVQLRAMHTLKVGPYKLGNVITPLRIHKRESNRRIFVSVCFLDVILFNTFPVFENWLVSSFPFQIRFVCVLCSAFHFSFLFYLSIWHRIFLCFLNFFRNLLVFYCSTVSDVFYF